MKKKAILAIAVFLLAGLFRFGWVTVNSIGGGRGAESPDKRFNGHATDWYRKKFWGGTHEYYEFTVETANGQRIQQVLMEKPPEGMISWREDGLMQWAADSSSVTFSFKGTQLILSVPPH